MANKTAEPREDNWEDVSISGAQYWHICEAGNAVEGFLLDRRYRKPNKNNPDGKWFYRVKLTKPTLCSHKEDRDSESVRVTVPAGTVVCIDERKDLEDLQPMTDDGGKYKVRLIPQAKIKLGSRTFWPWEKKRVVLKPATRTPAPMTATKKAVEEDAAPEDDSDIPF